MFYSLALRFFNCYGPTTDSVLSQSNSIAGFPPHPGIARLMKILLPNSCDVRLPLLPRFRVPTTSIHVSPFGDTSQLSLCSSCCCSSRYSSLRWGSSIVQCRTIGFSPKRSRIPSLSPFCRLPANARANSIRLSTPNSCAHWRATFRTTRASCARQRPGLCRLCIPGCHPSILLFFLCLSWHSVLLRRFGLSSPLFVQSQPRNLWASESHLDCFVVEVLPFLNQSLPGQFP